MQTLTFKTNINCEICKAKITPFMEMEKTIEHWQVDTEHADKILKVSGDHLSPELIQQTLNKAGYSAVPINGFVENLNPFSFWTQLNVWNKAAKNTTNCLIGCSIGDFGTVILFQMYFPTAPIGSVMTIAIMAGLFTSVIFETILLRINENFSWKQSFSTAFSMSFLSMLAMEIAENTTDFMLTGGNVSINDPFYWAALAFALAAGFLVPLPYNYFKLKKYGKACH